MQHAWYRNQDSGPPGFLLQLFGYDSNEKPSTVVQPRKHAPHLKFKPSSFQSYCQEKFTLVALVESNQAQNPKGPSRRSRNVLWQRPLMSQLQSSKRWQKTIISPSFCEAGNHHKSSITCTSSVRHKTIVSPPLHHGILHHHHHPSSAQQYRWYKMGIFHDYTCTTTHNHLPLPP